MVWFDTNTGEGAQAIITRTILQHEKEVNNRNVNFNAFSVSPDGKVLTGNFVDPVNKEVVICIPRKLYDEYKHYIQTLLLDPTNQGKITLRFVEEYIANSREDPDFVHSETLKR